MKIPTVEQFNNWSDKDKAGWIDYETKGNFKKVDASNAFPCIFYPAKNVAIVYKVTPSGELTEAFAMTMRELSDRLQQFQIAYKAKSSKN